MGQRHERDIGGKNPTSAVSVSTTPISVVLDADCGPSTATAAFDARSFDAQQRCIPLLDNAFLHTCHNLTFDEDVRVDHMPDGKVTVVAQAKQIVFLIYYVAVPTNKPTILFMKILHVNPVKQQRILIDIVKIVHSFFNLQCTVAIRSSCVFLPSSARGRLTVCSYRQIKTTLPTSPDILADRASHVL